MANNWTTIVGGTAAQQTAPAMMYGDTLSLVKTSDGNFVLSGANAQRLLMEYLEQAPEMWLRLMAVKVEKENG